MLWAASYYFLVLAAYFVIRPIRDEMGVAGGVRNLPWLFLGTLIGMLLVLGAPDDSDAGWPEVAAGVGAFVLVLLRRRWPLPLLAVALGGLTILLLPETSRRELEEISPDPS